MEEWKLEDKLACLTTDNGRNIVLAVEKLGWKWLKRNKNSLSYQSINLSKRLPLDGIVPTRCTSD